MISYHPHPSLHKFKKKKKKKMHSFLKALRRSSPHRRFWSSWQMLSNCLMVMYENILLGWMDGCSNPRGLFCNRRCCWPCHQPAADWDGRHECQEECVHHWGHKQVPPANAFFAGIVTVPSLYKLPWCNCTCWLGVKKQVTYLRVILVFQKRRVATSLIECWTLAIFFFFKDFL